MLGLVPLWFRFCPIRGAPSQRLPDRVVRGGCDETERCRSLRPLLTGASCSLIAVRLRMRAAHVEPDSGASPRLRFPMTSRAATANNPTTTNMAPAA